MKINKIISQSRRDFTALYECETCNHTQEGYGYDDRNFHDNVIPQMKCNKCGNTSKGDYRPLQPKYEEWQTV